MSSSPDNRRGDQPGRRIVIAALSARDRDPIYLAIPFLVLDAGFIRYTNKPTLVPSWMTMKRSVLSSASAIYKVLDSKGDIAASVSLRAVTAQVTEFRLSIPGMPRRSAAPDARLSRAYDLAKMMEYCLRSIYEDYSLAQQIEDAQTPVFTPGEDLPSDDTSRTELGAKLTPREVIDLIFDPPIDYEEESDDVLPEISGRPQEEFSTPGSPKNLFRIRVGRPSYPEDEWLREQVYIHNKEPNESLYQEWRARWSGNRYPKHSKLAFKHALKLKNQGGNK